MEVPHDVGEVWASLLNDMYWNLVSTFGFSKDLFNPKEPQGNIIAIHLLMGGLMHQPCNPNFITGRDAILISDQNYFQGKYKCSLWKAFAKRGLGVKASSYEIKNNFEIPQICK